MLRSLCNELCIRAQLRLRVFVVWLAAICGLKVVEAEAVILPKGFLMFDNALAKQVGVERAAIYQKIKGWQEYNCRQGKQSHFRHDRWWTYGTPEYWLKNEFIWSSISTIRRAFNDLEKAGLMAIDRAGGELWLSALAGETVNLTTPSFNVQLDLFNVDSEASNRRSSIGNPSTLKQAKGKGQTTFRAPRKAAVADFAIPEYRDQVGEIRESREGDVDGRDILAQLPGELVTGWTDAKLPLEQLVAQHGVERINRKWDEAKNFKSQVAGLRTLLAKAPAPYPPVPPPPPSTADDTTEQDWTSEDVGQISIPMQKESGDTASKSWLEKHVDPALLANGGVSW